MKAGSQQTVAQLSALGIYPALVTFETRVSNLLAQKLELVLSTGHAALC